MLSADSTARQIRPSEEVIRRALEAPAPAVAKHGSGFFAVVDEFAGLDRLDRAELDEVD
jgi:hypothetical protein